MSTHGESSTQASTIKKLQIKFDELQIGSEVRMREKKPVVADSMKRSASTLAIGKKRTFKELEKHEIMPSNSSESNVSRKVHLNERLL